MQFEYQTTPALLLGPTTALGITEARGFDELPNVRTSDTPRPADHGLFAGRDFAGGRVVELDLTITGTTDLAFRASVQSLADATVFRQDELPLVFRLPGYTANRRVNCRPRRRSLPDNWDLVHRAGRATLQFVATDPRIFTDAETVLTTAAATAGGGRVYNRVYNLTYAAGGTGGTLIATNEGNFETRPRLKITGPCDTPKIENVTASKFLQINVNVAAGDFLEIDTDARTILLNGTASRYSSLSSDSSWWVLDPGSSSLKFTSANNVGTLEVRFRSAFL